MVIPYDLTFFADANPPLDVVRAELRSPLLDPVTHPEGSVIAHFALAFSLGGKRRFLLDSFQVDSVVAYLQSQGHIRYTLEAELADARASWLGVARQPDPNQVWAEARVASVSFEQRRSGSAEALARDAESKYSPLHGLTGEDIERIVAHSDKPDTWASFTVCVEVDWDEEHRARMATFRDGAFDGFEI
jgi:hypothetical protein